MKFLSLVVAFFMFTSVAQAKDYTFYLPSGPGSYSDTVGRAIAQAFNEQNPGDRLTVLNRPGGDQIVAINHFVKDDLGVFLGGTTAHVFNYFYRQGPLPYSDDDFDYVMFLGTSPQTWFTRAGSEIKTAKDLVEVLPYLDRPLVGLDHSLAQANLLALREKYKLNNIREIRYKTASDVMVSTMSGQQPVGIGSPSPQILSNVKAGNLVILGTTEQKHLELDGVSLPPLNASLDVTTFSAALTISINPRMPTKTAEKLHQQIIAAVRSDIVQDLLKKTGTVYDGATGPDAKKKILDYRTKVGDLQK